MENFLYGINNYVYSTFTSLIAFNYYIGDTLVSSLLYCVQVVTSVFTAIADACVVLIQDLDVFLSELFEYILTIKQSLAELGDNLEFKSPISPIIDHNVVLFNAITSIVSDFFYGIGHNILDSLSLIPNTFHFMTVFIQSLYSICCRKEVLLGALISFLIGYVLLKSLFQIRRRVPSQVLEQFTSFLSLAIYSIILRGGSCTLSIIRCILRAAVLTLHHIHLPSFHYAATDPIELEESSKRQQLRSMLDDITGREDVQVLLEQLEREDKLCVVCQDQEKCMVIMPCRHLCICQRCKELLLQGTRSCPICRKKIGHTIKAYF